MPSQAVASATCCIVATQANNKICDCIASHKLSQTNDRTNERDLSSSESRINPSSVKMSSEFAFLSLL